MSKPQESALCMLGIVSLSIFGIKALPVCAMLHGAWLENINICISPGWCMGLGLLLSYAVVLAVLGAIYLAHRAWVILGELNGKKKKK